MPTVPVILREVSPSDAPVIAELANNKKIWNNVRDRMPYPYALKDAEHFVEQVLKEEGPTVHAITFEGKVTGLIGLHPSSDVYRGTAELGYWIGEPYWGQGIASAAVAQVIPIGFEQLNLRRIHASVYEHNHASMRVLEKNGFQREGVARAAVLKNGQVLDEVRYGLVNLPNS